MISNPDDREHRRAYISLIEQYSVSHGINGRYFDAKRLDDNAGGGGFSLVFKAEDRSNGKPVALKFFDPSCGTNLDRIRCFQRESDILQSLQGQPNIIQLVEPRRECTITVTYPPTGMQFPLSFEYIGTELASSDVKECIYDTDTQPLQSLVYFREMCKGVQRVHAHHIRHRDIKPDNFLIVGGGSGRKICLGDFGSARCFGPDGQALAESYPIPGWRGDLWYIAPELLGLVPADADSFRRGDMYSLGASLFEMFTRQKLGSFVYDERFFSQLYETAQHGRSELPLAAERMGQIVRQIVRDARLPEIFDLADDVPAVIRARLNGLCKGMANLDSRKRICDFEVVFREVNRCIEVLENRTKYERWMQLKELWSERRRQRIETRESRQL